MSTIITRNSATSGSTPSSLVQGELAINVANGRLFYGSGSANIVKEFTGSGVGGNTFPFTGSALITGSLGVTGSLNVSTGITGSLQGTASYATQALSASYASTAEYVNGMKTKSNVVLNTSFAGTPLTSLVTFSTVFPDTDYSILVTGEDARAWTIESKTESGFTINTNSSIGLIGSTFWQATSYGEFNS